MVQYMYDMVMSERVKDYSWAGMLTLSTHICTQKCYYGNDDFHRCIGVCECNIFDNKAREHIHVILVCFYVLIRSGDTE